MISLAAARSESLRNPSCGHLSYSAAARFPSCGYLSYFAAARFLSCGYLYNNLPHDTSHNYQNMRLQGEEFVFIHHTMQSCGSKEVVARDFLGLVEHARKIIAEMVHNYTFVRPHGSLKGLTPAEALTTNNPEAIVPLNQIRLAAKQRIAENLNSDCNDCQINTSE